MTRRAVSRLLTAFSLTAALAWTPLPLTGEAASAAAWPGLRGPHHDGSVRGTSLIDHRELALGPAWKKPLGSGYSSLVVGDGRVITLFAAGEEDVAAAFDVATGAEVWRTSIGKTYAGHDGSHDGPISTPLLADGRVYALSAWGELFALDAASGEKLWTKNLVEEHGAVKPWYGFTTSPVLASGVLVVEIGAGEGKSIAGFDPADGELRWSLGDDPINYHSPAVATIAGRRVVLAAGAKTLYGIDPATGVALWSVEHEGDDSAMGGETIIPVPAGEDRVLLMNEIGASAMYAVASGAEGYEVSKLWSDKSLSRSYVHPVYHEGHLYGMAGRIFTCADAATGEMKWRSRQPGDGFPTLVGDHLVIITKAGSLHVAEASPDGYEELAAIELFEDNSWSAVAYADGALYARSMSEIARVDPVAAAVEAGAEGDAAWLDGTAFGRFLAEVEAAEDKAAAVDAFLGRQESFPIIEGLAAVHFVYRGGEANDVGIVGDMIGFRREEPMIRVPGTDLFHFSTVLEPDAAVAYGFIPDFGSAIADPLNPRSARGLFGEVSLLTMPAWQEADFLAEPPAGEGGRLETVEWESQVREGQERRASVYLPSGYDAEPDRRYPVLYVTSGKEALEAGQLQRALDNLIGVRIEPLIAVFIEPGGDNPRRDLADAEGYVEMVAKELVPLIEGRYRARGDRMGRAIAGVADGATAALAGAFQHRDLFGKVIAESPIMMRIEQVTAKLPPADEQITVVYHGWGTYHIRSPHEGFNMVETNRELWRLLRERGYRPAGGETPDGFGWACWRARADDWLTALFPLG